MWMGFGANAQATTKRGEPKIDIQVARTRAAIS